MDTFFFPRRLGLFTHCKMEFSEWGAPERNGNYLTLGSQNVAFQARRRTDWPPQQEKQFVEHRTCGETGRTRVEQLEFFPLYCVSMVQNDCKTKSTVTTGS